MKRFFLVLAVAALMAMMLVVMAAPAMAKGSGGVVQIDTFNDRLTVFSKDNNPLKEPVTVAYPIDPIKRLNPNLYPSDPI